jgi:hypothetical protein
VAQPRKTITLVKAFLAPRVLTFEKLSGRLHVSRSTIIRRLNEHGYYSSYNFSGRFLTIDEVAHFDSNGLWAYKGAHFSKHGTLKDTVDYFVSSSEGGMIHRELAKLLGVRVHNSLLELVREDRISREELGPTLVYFSRKRSARRQQILRRKAILKERQKLEPTSSQIIATLVEVIKDPKAARQEIVAGCRRAGVAISRELVDVIFEKYDLDKKRARLRSTRS